MFKSSNFKPHFGNLSDRQQGSKPDYTSDQRMAPPLPPDTQHQCPTLPRPEESQTTRDILQWNLLQQQTRFYRGAGHPEVCRGLHELERGAEIRLHVARSLVHQCCQSAQVRLPWPNQQVRLLGQGFARKVCSAGEHPLLSRVSQRKRDVCHKRRGQGPVFWGHRRRAAPLGPHRHLRKQHVRRIHRLVEIRLPDARLPLSCCFSSSLMRLFFKSLGTQMSLTMSWDVIDVIVSLMSCFDACKGVELSSESSRQLSTCVGPLTTAELSWRLCFARREHTAVCRMLFVLKVA